MWPFTKKKPERQYLNMMLNRYQVHVYNCNHELLTTVICEGFTPLMALDMAREGLKDAPIDKLLYPLTFFTVVK